MHDLPTKEQLPALRKGLRKREAPTVRAGMHGSFCTVGSFSVTPMDDTFVIEWSRNGHDSKSAEFRALSTDPTLELDRLELGWLISNMFDLEVQRIMDSIGHPIDAFNAAAESRKKADVWRHWAKVKAGYMVGL